jgi:DNA-binding NarL/FixJ family response regulator
MDDPLRLIVLANDPLARAGLAALLAGLPDCRVVAQGSAELLDDAAGNELDPADAIVWDVGWDWDGPREGEERLGAGLPVLALVADEEGAAAAWALGCRGVVGRATDEEQLLAAVRAVAAGLAVIAPALAGALLQAETAATTPTAVELTPRESQVLALLAEGLTNKAIAHQLSISDHTVKFHVNAILGKLNAQSRTDAVVRATRQGLIAL